MAKFESDMSDLVVSTDNGFIQFKDGFFTTTNKAEIEALKKAIGVKEVGGKPIKPPVQKPLV